MVRTLLRIVAEPPPQEKPKPGVDVELPKIGEYGCNPYLKVGLEKFLDALPKSHAEIDGVYGQVFKNMQARQVVGDPRFTVPEFYKMTKLEAAAAIQFNLTFREGGNFVQGQGNAKYCICDRYINANGRHTNRSWAQEICGIDTTRGDDAREWSAQELADGICRIAYLSEPGKGWCPEIKGEFGFNSKERLKRLIALTKLIIIAHFYNGTLYDNPTYIEG